MTFEAVIGQKAAQVRMARERHAVEIEGFALEPVGAGKNLDDRGDRRRFAGLDLHADALVMRRRQQMIDDVETPRPSRPIDRGHVDEANKRATGIVAQETRHCDNFDGFRRDGQFAAIHRVAANRAGKRLGDGLAEGFE
jgi:hypothetical protein